MEPHIIDRIYESAFLPEFWRKSLRELAEIAGAVTGWMFVAGSAEPRFTASSALAAERIAPVLASGAADKSERLKKLFAARHHGFLREIDLYSEKELDEDEFYRKYIRSIGFGYCASTALTLPTSERVVLTLEREYVRGPVEPATLEHLDALRPHLARALLLAARLQLERARATGQTLAALGLPALVLDAQGKVLAANSLVERLPDFLMWRALDRVSLTDRLADQLLRDAISTIEMPQGGVRSFPVRHAESGTAMVAHLIPIRLSARDVFLRSAAALVLTPVTAPQAPPVELVQSLFDLTPAEARVARSLAGGETVDSIASVQGVSQNTVRSHIRGVLEKTGCNRQADVVSLLTSISPGRLITSI
jgi:DNA-binding CsgD family transcriptional regulator